MEQRHIADKKTSSGAAIVLYKSKSPTVTKVLPIEIHVILCGLQATHKPILLPQSCHHRQTSTGAAIAFKITNSNNSGAAAHRNTCGALWASGDAQAQTLTSAELPSTADAACVCVCFLPIHSGHQVRWTYQPGSHRRKVTQDFSSTFFLRCVPLFFSREGFSHSFPSSTVKSNFVY